MENMIWVNNNFLEWKVSIWSGKVSILTGKVRLWRGKLDIDGGSLILRVKVWFWRGKSDFDKEKRIFYVKSVLVITGTISYQFWGYKYGIDTEFYSWSNETIFIDIFLLWLQEITFFQKMSFLTKRRPLRARAAAEQYF